MTLTKKALLFGMAHLTLTYNVKPVLLDIVDNPIHIIISLDAWVRHYDEIFQIMIRKVDYPDNMLMVNFDVG